MTTQNQEKLAVDEVKENEVKVDPVKARMEEMQKLMAEGKSLEEALRLTLHYERVAITNRVEYIKGLTSIALVRKAKQGAHAKLSKAKQAGNVEAQERYLEEIRTADEKLNELMAVVNKDPDSLKRAIEMGESESGIVQMMILKAEEEVNTQLEKAKIGFKWTKKELKTAINSQPITTPSSLTEKLRAVSVTVEHLYELRLKGGDKRVETLNKKLNLLADLHKKLKEAQAKQGVQNNQVEEKETNKPAEAQQSKPDNQPKAQQSKPDNQPKAQK